MTQNKCTNHPNTLIELSPVSLGVARHSKENSEQLNHVKSCLASDLRRVNSALELCLTVICQYMYVLYCRVSVDNWQQSKPTSPNLWFTKHHTQW